MSQPSSYPIFPLKQLPPRFSSRVVSSPLQYHLYLTVGVQIRSIPLPPMSYDIDRIAAHSSDQQSSWQYHLSCCGAELPHNSSVRMNSNPIPDWQSRCMLLGSTCVSDLPNMSQRMPYPNAGFSTPKSFSPKLPISPARSPTSTISQTSESGGVTYPPDLSNTNLRKEKRREQNRRAQRGKSPSPLLSAR